MATAGDTAFGVTRYCEHAIWDDLPKIAFCTQEYNLFTQNKVEFGESAVLYSSMYVQRRNFLLAPCLLLELAFEGAVPCWRFSDFDRVL